MFIVIRPDHYDREPTIDFYKDDEIDTTKSYNDFIIKKFYTINELKCILLDCIDTAKNIIFKIGKDGKPTDIWHLKCLNCYYYIDNDSVAHTQLFESWGLNVDIKTINKELIKGNGFEHRPYNYYINGYKKGK